MSTVAHILKNASEQKISLDFPLIINKLILSVSARNERKTKLCYGHLTKKIKWFTRERAVK
jgi:hypothetical protein